MCFYFVLFSYGIYLRMIADILFRQPVTEQVFRCLQQIGETTAALLGLRSSGRLRGRRQGRLNAIA